MQVDVASQLRGDVHHCVGVLKERIGFMGRGFRVVVHVLFFYRGIREGRREFLPETRWDRVEGVPIPWLQD